MVELEGLSTEAKIGKILILVGIIIDIIGLVALAVMGTVGFAMPFYGMGFFAGLVIIIGILAIIGLILGISAYSSASKGDFHNAGIMAIVASFLPPLDVITLIGSILCLVSPEAKGSPQPAPRVAATTRRAARRK